MNIKKAYFVNLDFIITQIKQCAYFHAHSYTCWLGIVFFGLCLPSVNISLKFFIKVNQIILNFSCYVHYEVNLLTYIYKVRVLTQLSQLTNHRNVKMKVLWSHSNQKLCTHVHYQVNCLIFRYMPNECFYHYCTVQWTWTCDYVKKIK